MSNHTLPTTVPLRAFQDDGSFVIATLVSIMAAIGGSARYMNDLQKNKSPFSVLKFIVKIVTCIFIGITAWSACIGLGVNNYLAIAASNLASWLGVEALSFTWEIVQGYIRKRFL